MRASFTWSLMVVLGLAGCGGASSGSEGGTGTDGTTGSEDDIPTAENWEGMSHDDKAAWMAQEVVPRMEALFTGHDADRYANFSCRTCHGEGAAHGDFEMPSRSLPALHPTGSPEQQAMVQQYRPMLVFMYQEVLPTMQQLIGAPDFEEETGGGFSCFACHPHAGDEGTTPLITLEPAEAAADEAGDAG
ncbi:MAG: hypothetical protein H6719_06735 [Sandaracinaceae bacterium]|nr:hypothetical protein [Sandaracinaceae bacterium]